MIVFQILIFVTVTLGIAHAVEIHESRREQEERRKINRMRNREHTLDMFLGNRL